MPEYEIEAYSEGVEIDEERIVKSLREVVEDRFNEEPENRISELGKPIINDIDDAEEGIKFYPKGWVGKFTEDVIVKPHIDDVGFDEMKTSVAKWIETPGPETARSVLSFVPDIPEMTKSRYRSYSRQLVEQTENIIAHRPPIETRFVEEQNVNSGGRPLPKKTAQARAKGNPVPVTQRVEFTVETPFNRLLVRFHLELANSLESLTETSQLLDMSSSIEYHREFVPNQFPPGLTAQSLEEDFTNPDKLDTLRRSVSSEAEKTVIDLWEGFLYDVGLEIDVSRRLDTTIIPAEKIYELYVLKNILDVLEDMLEEDGDISIDENGNKEFKIEFSNSDVELCYDKELDGRFLEIFGEKHRPDYLLKCEDERVWVGDAKFRESINTQESDVEERGSGKRFIGYLIDLLEDKKTGTLILPETDVDPIPEEKDRGYQIEFISLSEGDNGDNNLGELRNTLETALD